MSGGQGEAPAPDALTTGPRAPQGSPRPGLDGARKAACEGPGAEVGRDLLSREASKGRRQRPHARPACNEMIEPCKAGACPHSGLHSARPSTPARRLGRPLRLILPCSLLLSGGAVRPHQSDPAAWNRPRGAGADGGRRHVHPGVCWLCGGPAGEHLPAQVCEWPQGWAGAAWGFCWADFFLLWAPWLQLSQPPWALCALPPQMVRFQETIRGASSSSPEKAAGPSVLSSQGMESAAHALPSLAFYLPPRVLKELFVCCSPLPFLAEIRRCCQ